MRSKCRRKMGFTEGQWIFIIVGASCIAWLAMVGWYESKYPCLEYGQREVSHIVRGVAQYHTPCTMRQK